MRRRAPFVRSGAAPSRGEKMIGIRTVRRALLAVAVSVVAGAAATAPASAATVTISGPSDSQMCWIRSLGGSGCGLALSGLTSDGLGEEFRGLYWFDVAGNVPATATVTSATLRLPKLGLPTACGLNLWGIGQGADWL